MDTPSLSVHNDSTDDNLRKEKDMSETLTLDKNTDHGEETCSKDVSPESPKVLSDHKVASPQTTECVLSKGVANELDKESDNKDVSPQTTEIAISTRVEDERDKKSDNKDVSPQTSEIVPSTEVEDKDVALEDGQTRELDRNTDKDEPPSTGVQDERDKESDNKDVSPQTTEVVPATGVEDEDVVLEGDEQTREFDGNIDEDELLKDTDGDEPKTNVASVIETESGSNNTLQFENLENSNLDTNQNISSIPCSGVERRDEHTENVTDRNCTNIEDNVNGSSNKKISELEAESSEHRPSDVDIVLDTGTSKDKSLVHSNLDHEKSLRTDDSTEPSNETDNVSRDYNDTSQDTEILRKESVEEMDTDVHKGDNENSKDSVEEIQNDEGNENSKDCVEETENDEVNENSKDSVEDTENDEVTSFLHVDQDSSRPDDSYDTMEAEGEDPFAQTSDEAMDTSETTQKDADLDQAQSCNAINEFVDDNTSNAESEVQPTDSTDKMDTTESSALVESNGHVSSSAVQPTEETATNNEKCDSGGDKNLSDKTENNLKVDKIQDSEVCIVPDAAAKKAPTEENDVPVQPITVVHSSKNKSGKSSHKSKSKSKITISDDSSDDNNSDFEIGSRSGTRPKRSAAKKAETQIRVMSAVEQEEVEPEDLNNDDADSIEEVSNEKADSIEEVPNENADSIEEVPNENADIETCFTCKKVSECKVSVLTYGKLNYFCDENCFSIFRDGPLTKVSEAAEIVPPSTVINQIKSADIQPNDRAEFIRKCAQCTTVVRDDDERTLSWETMDFCSEECLGKYQQELGSYCANCKGSVQPASLGKYCVRFGYEVKQFCCSSCLEEFKKGLKVCSFCQKDISSGAEGFLAPVGDKGTFKDFCTQACMEKYEQMSSNQPPPPQIHPCHVCNNHKVVEVEVFLDSKVNKLCSDICFTAYKFANKLTVDRCDMCRKYFDKDANGEKFNIFYDAIPHNFCCKTCMNVYILAKRKIVPCNWCKVKKYNFDMIKRVQNTGQVLMMCSLNCLTLYQVSVNAVSSRRIKCDMCMSVAQAQYHLTMSDATIRNFCTYPCVMNFQQQYTKSPITLPGSDAPPIPTGAPKRAIQKNESSGSPVPVISSVSSLANGPSNATPTTKMASDKLNLVMRLLEPPVCRNKNTQTRPIMNTKSVSCRPHSTPVHVQTDEDKGRPILIPIPVPIYVPCPMPMYSFPFPVPVPIPIPVPIPVFLPTTRNSIKGILKEIKRIQEKVPSDPFEAELLMMAEMVAEDKKEVATSSDSDNEPDIEPASCDTRPNSDGEGELSSGATETSNTFGEDIMQIALKMATELDEPADLETQLTPATILNQNQDENKEGSPGDVETPKKSTTGENKSRKRSATKSPQKTSGSSDTKRKKPSQNSDSGATNPPPAVEEPKPDALLKLKYTFGVNAWKSWVTQKNAEIERLSSTNKKIKPFKTDILQLTADELNFSLCLFVKEVKKPNGTQYAPDTIYYLCLGIQQYLFVNGRIDNIFTDSYFESFTDALDEVAKKFTELFNDHHYIVTRVEEEHLWESKQLGAHSPHVLLSTLMFFNTKHFNLTNVDEHMMLSFSHIMKHWKRNPNQQTTTGSAKAPGSRNVLLRFYPPQAVLDDPNSKKKKVYEQHENEENPLRCAVKLYEFYLSKCPESVRTRNDVFYLQPERSCVPDSPVWYSTMALGKEPLEKMLNRVKMVKEINIALLMP